jgi:hypothetical protein
MRAVRPCRCSFVWGIRCPFRNYVDGAPVRKPAGRMPSCPTVREQTGRRNSYESVYVIVPYTSRSWRRLYSVCPIGCAADCGAAEYWPGRG